MRTITKRRHVRQPRSALLPRLDDLDCLPCDDGAAVAPSWPWREVIGGDDDEGRADLAMIRAWVQLPAHHA